MQWQSLLDNINRKVATPSLIGEINDNRNEFKLISLIMSNSTINELIISWLEKQNKMKITKCTDQAKRLKDKGNLYFKEKNYLASIDSYTDSAKYADFYNGDFSIALANRSAAFFFMSRYDQCLEDIAVAIQSNYPKKLKYKLHLRATQCYIKLHKFHQATKELSEAEKLIKNAEDISKSSRENLMNQIENLSSQIIEGSEKNFQSSNLRENKLHSHKYLFNPNELLPLNINFPSASSKLSREYSPTRGRHVIANESIQKGDVLFVEKPFAFVPLDNATSDILCTHCCGLITDSAIPCRSCSSILYCSRECWMKSWSYHKFECSGYQSEIWKQIGIAHLALKSLLISVETDDVTRFNDVEELVTNIDKLNSEDLIMYSVAAMMLTLYLKKYTDFFTIIDIKKCLIDKFKSGNLSFPFDNSSEESQKLFIGSIILRHMLQLIANGHAITRLNLTTAVGADVFEEQQQRIAVGIYPSASMMNHSCDPTILTTFSNDYLIVKAIKDVVSGEEVFNCYGPYFRRMPFEERQKALKDQYRFDCKCKPCTDPDLKQFLDRFTGVKCPECNGPLEKSITHLSRCLDCNASSKIDIDMQTELKTANDLSTSAQEYLQMGKNKEAIDYLKRCLNIRQKWLYKYHDDIAITLDNLAKINIIMGNLLNSMPYLEQNLAIVDKKFGNESIEAANEINKITDVNIQYLQQNDKHSKTSIYKDTLKNTQDLIDRGRKIMSIIAGPWNEIYQELTNKKNQLLMLECYI
ncbi:Similar to SMYD4: SET and MYND domain-containing protein 4 (Homo sapiens) [Cotesia congregata]|uniref:Protein-lysine N-methyltransferase SMYD4 n=1 Tax=Cotesia congregata TaxID=51543 RepID=A0A8J2MPD3_COTCN|nr:Similar to SMYD4: SET and MYND domain-containing protein 4 (Homo sapiens) [Cotesia congregata]